MSLKRGLALLVVVIILPYARPPVYRFPAPAPFSGASFLNPYAAAGGPWQRANLHAHARAWGGLTNGRQSAAEVVDEYRRRGYSVAAVSNYQQIAARDGVDTIPVYEHGYNIDKGHQLAIGARDVEWFDLPLWQSVSDQQFVIDRVKSKSDLVALAHPSTRDAYSDDLDQLTGYDLIEVVNGPFIAEDLWDAALSAGRLAWAVADDDSHDLNDTRRIAIAWNMIGTPSTGVADVTAALRAGRTFAVMRTDEDLSPVEAVVPDVAFNDGTLRVSAKEPSTFLFIGQHGDVRQSNAQTTEATYHFRADDTYIRTVVRSARTATFVNPIVRYDGTHVPAPVAAQNAAATWLARASVLTAAACLLVFAFKRRPKALASRRGAVVLSHPRRKRA